MTDAVEGRIASLTNRNDGLPPTAQTKPSSDQGTEAFKDISFGSIAGTIGKTIEYPFDTIKVRLQSQPDSLPLRYNGPLDCFRQSIRAEGLSGLYRGISAPLFGAAIETSSLFFSYRIAQDLLQATLLPPTQCGPLPLSALIACGGASGAFTSLLLTPIELVKCQMQVPLSTSSQRNPGPLSVIASVFRHRGIFGFWHGQLGTLIRETGGSAAWFGSYESVSAAFRKHNALSTPATVDLKDNTLPIYQQLVAGATAGVSYNFIFFPADTIKSRMQTEEVNARGSVQRTFWASGRALWQQQGLRGMYRGCGITVGRAAPSSAFIFAVYEGLRGWWG
ncbi:hypothetical protein MMC28_000100 [Mycoblastus sanguinarius]|nr:hypothetical protein [Mycoblastus sanguinarius]